MRRTASWRSGISRRRPQSGCDTENPLLRDVGRFDPDEAKRMLEFVAETAREAGLEDYRVIVNVGQGGGQTVFHLHWHVLGDGLEAFE
jgi:diadenosine tetraphosphate (Ap4A) HIT family hydrolase